ncbi:hypothetical protein D3OALGA1CA_5073 [Olavius algarvensis associated proteobacterium Delta 3]|nr:hypothetical protein D3OALGA1CA_5073 [Olavius algarvensis associated proteobacterium Delta 3]
MAVSKTLEYYKVKDLFLDPLNPRLGRHRSKPDTPQDVLLDWMTEQVLDELALSYIESGGFWTQEALLVVEEVLYEEKQPIVVEGNRRLAALMCLQEAVNSKARAKTWTKIAESALEKGPEFIIKLFTSVPVLKVDSRRDMDEFLGFRHVTGIKQWAPAEKAQFINMLLREKGYNYQEVTRKIGSKIPAVKKSYISFRLLLQIEDTLEENELPIEQLEDRFSLLYSCLTNPSVREYLNISLDLTVEEAIWPISDEKVPELKFFVRCLYGDKGDKEPLVSDTRQITDFGKILESEEAIEYINKARRPEFQTAFEIAGGTEQNIDEEIRSAIFSIRSILGRVHLFKKSKKIRKAVKKFKLDADALLSHFPDIEAEDD